MGVPDISRNRISKVFGVDVHPAARISCGIIIDHGTSVVVGETAVVEDNVSILHEVILGNIENGIGSKVAAGSVVLRDVPPGTTVAGIPARVVAAVPSPPLARTRWPPMPPHSTHSARLQSIASWVSLDRPHQIAHSAVR
jgi:serine acetyltransferase